MVKNDLAPRAVLIQMIFTIFIPFGDFRNIQRLQLLLLLKDCLSFLANTFKGFDLQIIYDLKNNNKYE